GILTATYMAHPYGLRPPPLGGRARTRTVRADCSCLARGRTVLGPARPARHTSGPAEPDPRCPFGFGWFTLVFAVCADQLAASRVELAAVAEEACCKAGRVLHRALAFEADARVGGRLQP